MNLIRSALSTPKHQQHILPHCNIAIQQFSTSKNAYSVFNSWRDLVKNPTDWYDNRQKKLSGSWKANSPDFRHKTSGDALWLTSAPKSVLAGLEGLNVGRGKKDDSWNNLVENPSKWWDNRPTKTSLNAPDFVNKETQEPLWLNSAPKWALAMLEGLNVGRGDKDDSWKNLVENPCKWCDNRPTKTSANAPDFICKETNEGLWLDSSPKWVLAVLDGVNVGKKEDSWKNLVENPCKWWDMRSIKTNVKGPDFVNKESQECLWLNSAPEWALAMLEGLNVGKGKKYDSWKNLVENPDKWFDNRPRKTKGNEPDFVCKETNEGLWLRSSPKWASAVLDGLNVETGNKDDSWMNLVENPDKWWDNRPGKTNIKAPDFKHKETSEALWLDSSPKWALAMLEGLNVGT